jgi:hypothetical protein
MKQSRDALPMPDITGRDGAIDHIAKASATNSGFDHERFRAILGHAVIENWVNLPQPVQEQLFESAVVLGHHDERDEMLREQLAKFLHDHHGQAGR